MIYGTLNRVKGLQRTINFVVFNKNNTAQVLGRKERERGIKMQAPSVLYLIVNLSTYSTVKRCTTQGYWIY